MNKNKKLTISETDKKFLGVCGGIAEYLEVDSTLTRLVFLVLTFLPGFPGIFVYFILYLIIPRKNT